VDEPRLKGTGARTNAIPELGGKTYIAVWDAWIVALNGQLKQQHNIPLIPNDGNFGTTWDTSNYTLTAGVFSEGFASATLDDRDWAASTNQLLDLAARGKILILQDYLRGKPQVRPIVLSKTCNNVLLINDTVSNNKLTVRSGRGPQDVLPRQLSPPEARPRPTGDHVPMLLRSESSGVVSRVVD
jgi:hypothetical protein